MRCFFVRLCTVHLCNVHNAVVHPAVHDSRFRRTENNKLTPLFLLLNWIDSLGTSLRELVHKFRHRTLVLLKMLMLQKRVSPYPYLLSLPCPFNSPTVCYTDSLPLRTFQPIPLPTCCLAYPTSTSIPTLPPCSTATISPLTSEI